MNLKDIYMSESGSSLIYCLLTINTFYKCNAIFFIALVKQKYTIYKVYSVSFEPVSLQGVSIFDKTHILERAYI